MAIHLTLSFKKSFGSSYFPELWKKLNFKNYRPISLLLIFRKVFENTIFNKMSFDATLSLGVRSVFLDISKTFDKVWQKGYFIN